MKVEGKKYTVEDILSVDMFGGECELRLVCRKTRFSKLRAPQTCYECQKTIKPGEMSKVDTALLDNKWLRCDVCEPCMVEFLELVDPR